MIARSLIPTPATATGKLGLFLGILAISLALVPVMHYQEKSAGEKFLDDVKGTFQKYERHVEDDSRFRFSMEGEAKWNTMAMVLAVGALALGVVSLGSEWFSGGLAALIGLGVGAWIYFLS